MSRTMRSVLCVAAVAVGQFALPAAPAQAGPFLDWLFGRPAAVYPTPVAVPGAPVGAVTAGYPPAACPTGCPTGCPVTAAMPVVTTPTCPVTPACPTCPTATPVVAGYAPSYQTTMLRVPTTYYRPVVAAAPQPVTVLQPCNSYTYQVRREPIFGSLFRRPWLPYYGTPYVAGYGTPYVAGYRSPYVLGYGAPSTMVAYSPPVPGYVQQGYVQPGYVQQGFVQPAAAYGQPAVGNCAGCSPAATGMTYQGYAAPAAQGYAAPATIPNGQYTYPAAPTGNVGTEPADQTPALAPNSNFGTVPNGNYGYPPNGNVTTEQAPLNGNIGTVPAQPMNSNIGTEPDSAMHRPPFNPQAPASTRTGTTPATNAYQVRPIPDPEANRDTNSTRSQAPPLLDTRERNASVNAPRTKTVTQAVWMTEKKPTSSGSAPTPAPAPSNPPQKFWNDSGWQSAKSW